jgi:uncharacterized Zn finger protein
MLAHLGRIEEAVDEGLHLLNQSSQLFALARVLRERQELEGALRVAKYGLTAEGYKGHLAAWLCDMAVGMGEMACALKAARVAFREMPSLVAYQRVQELAGERWPEMRKDLLAYLRGTSDYASVQAKVDIFLHEGFLDDAIAAVERGANYDLIERVMDAVVEHRPTWVVSAARQEAERIIEAGQSKYYHHAVNWLARMRKAYQAAGREADWWAYLSEIRDRHGRKYKLMGLLEAFGHQRPAS